MDAAGPWVIGTLVVYLVAMLALGAWARGRVDDVEDFVLAGRRLGLGLATPTLLATWFGAGTLLAATDEVRAEGLKAAALDPLGAGVCLLLAGWWLAKPLWEMGVLTLPDVYGRAYGPAAERAASLLMVPGYFGWIAAQFVALAAVAELWLGVPHEVALVAVAVFGVVYTWMGGMWAVTVTDAVQVVGVGVGVVLLAGVVLAELGGGEVVAGWTRLWAETPAEKATWIPAGEALAWTGLFAAGALGNLPGQDLTQRMFAARSAEVARWACWIAGAAYLTLGLVPLVLGLAADLVLPDHVDEAILPALAGHLLHPSLAVVLVLTVASAVLSTIDSAILAPATVLAHNVAGRWLGLGESVAWHRAAVLAVAGASLGLAFAGEDAYSLLEVAYELGMVSLLVPLLGAVWWPSRPQAAALAAMAVGTGLWATHLVLGVDGLFGTWVPAGLGAAACAATAFVVWPGDPRPASGLQDVRDGAER